MDCVNFTINGLKYTVGGEVSSTTTLLEFLRRSLELRGTKFMCLEGGCGSCIVSAKKTPNSNSEAVNSCLVSITSCDGWEITTIEKLGNRLDGYHPLQKTLAETNGSQCGFCSPGFVMSMYSLLKSRKKLTMLEIEQELSSNICRCTGYRSILEAFKKFASDAPKPNILDMEDVTLCSKKKNICLKNSCDESDWCFIKHDNLENDIKHIQLNDDRQWFKVYNIDDIFHILQTEGNDSYMLVAGNTGKGVRHIVEYPRILIDVTGVSELKEYIFDQNLVIGAGTTLTELIDIFKDVSDSEYFDYLKIVNDHLRLVAHVAVRNLGTIAGNLMLKHKYHDFNSDLFIIFQTIGAQVTLTIAPGVTKIITMEKFLEENMRGKIILNIMFPPLSQANKLVTFKVSARSSNAHAILNAGFLYKLNPENKVIKCRVIFGGLSPNYSQARRTENNLVGKILFDNDTLQSALKDLSTELIVVENQPEPSIKYRKRVALGLFYKSLLSLCPQEKLNSRYKSGSINLHQSRPVSTASQTFTSDPALWPLNQPIPKVDALLQCAGESIYTNDLPSLPREVFATFVLTNIAKGTIDSIDAREALSVPGVFAFYKASDIPGVNSFTSPEDLNGTTNEVILCDGEILYYNQPLGIIVAESSDIANRAALLVKVKYRNKEAPEIDIRKNKNNPSKVTLYKSIEGTEKGNDIVKVIKGEQTIFGQNYFCLENMSCISCPSEEGLKVLPSSHFLTTAHLMTSRCLNIEQNRIDMEVRRIGGSFGLKLSRQTIVTTACSLVAYKLNRPCRFIIPMQTQTRAIGKRMPSSTNYEVGVDKKGVIQYINYDIYEDNGYIINEILIRLTLDSYYNCYNRKRWNYRCFNALTDTPSNTWFRSPGSMETITATEMIMERISYELGLDPLETRLINLDKMRFKDLIEMVDTLKTNCDYFERRKAVNRYNSQNRWKKRGLRFVLMRWFSSLQYLLNITLSVYSGDGSVAIIHGGVDLGQGINTKATQVCAYFLNIPVSKIQIKATNTMACPNNTNTAASLTTQNVALGVERCCKLLIKRLEPIKQQMNKPTWEQIIAKAFKLGINLQANSLATFDDVYDTNVFGVTLAEVEIDVLTGESEILNVDIIEDVGRSINPYIDIGQIEGAFVQGTGYWTSEELVYNDRTGELLTDRTWNYFVPLCNDIAQNFTVHFRDRSYSSDVILGTKATAEPAICMGVVVPLAMREAMVSARSDSGLPSNKWFQIDGPYTVEKICLSCETKFEDFKFY